jgi:hypothetical protein
MEAVVPVRKFRRTNRPPFKDFLRSFAQGANITFALIEKAYEAYCANHLQATYHAAINHTEASYLQWQAFEDARSTLKPLVGEARRPILVDFVNRMDALLDRIEELGSDHLLLVSTQRDGKEALARGRPEEAPAQPIIPGERVRHYTNFHSIGPITSSDSLRIFSAATSPFGKASDKGVIFAMPEAHFGYLDQMQPPQIKDEFLIKGQNECKAYVEFNLEESVCASSRKQNDKIKKKFVKQQVELQISDGIHHLRRRAPVWYAYLRGSWEVVHGECPWGEENAEYVEAQNIIRVKPVEPKASSSSGEKPAAAPERKDPRDRRPAGQRFGPNDNNA